MEGICISNFVLKVYKKKTLIKWDLLYCHLLAILKWMIIVMWNIVIVLQVAYRGGQKDCKQFKRMLSSSS